MTNDMHKPRVAQGRHGRPSSSRIGHRPTMVHCHSSLPALLHTAVLQHLREVMKHRTSCWARPPPATHRIILCRLDLNFRQMPQSSSAQRIRLVICCVIMSDSASLLLHPGPTALGKLTRHNMLRGLFGCVCPFAPALNCGHVCRVPSQR